LDVLQVAFSVRRRHLVRRVRGALDDALGITVPEAEILVPRLDGVGLRAVEDERQEARRTVVVLGEAPENGARRAGHAAVAQRYPIAHVRQAGLIVVDVDAGVKQRGDFASGEVELQVVGHLPHLGGMYSSPALRYRRMSNSSFGSAPPSKASICSASWVAAASISCASGMYRAFEVNLFAMPSASLQRTTSTNRLSHRPGLLLRSMMSVTGSAGGSLVAMRLP